MHKNNTMENSEMTHEDKMEFYAKETMKSNKVTADWAMFRGIVTILGLVTLVLGGVYFINY